MVLYLVCCVAMLFSSATYHGLPHEHALKSTFWHLDHALIWISLAATYTTVQALFLPVDGARFRARLLWALALTGVILELSVLESLPLWVSPLLYVGMGWACFPILLAVFRRHGAYPAGLMFAGGVIVSIGGVIDSTSLPNLYPGVFEAHELLHLTTVVAFYAHWWPISQGADGRFLETCPEPLSAPAAAT
jgi:hemolysin III